MGGPNKPAKAGPGSGFSALVGALTRPYHWKKEAPGDFL